MEKEIKNMKITISTSNSKLGYAIPTISLPPQCSCRKDAPCTKGCYGKKGNFLFKNVQESHMGNYKAYAENPDAYFDEVIAYLSNPLITHKFFRWHAVGDIVDERYLIGMIRVAKKCKSTKFLCFTKKFDLVNEYMTQGGSIPSNLKIVFSAWSKGFKVDNPYNFPVAYVFFKKADMNPNIPEMAIPCKGHCPECLACWGLRKGQSVYFNEH